jgi:hypothetical protein
VDLSSSTGGVVVVSMFKNAAMDEKESIIGEDFKRESVSDEVARL